MGPQTAFFCVILGVLGVYCELIWPARVWQAVLGLGTLAAGGYFLAGATPTKTGLGLIALAAAFFLIDAFVDTHFPGAIIATVALTLGFLRLIKGARALSPVLVVPLCLVLGGVTAVLNRRVRRARENKRADLL